MTATTEPASPEPASYEAQADHAAEAVRDTTDAALLTRVRRRGEAAWSVLPEPVRATLPVWVASRLGVALASLVAARVFAQTTADNVPGFTELWDRWDVGLFTKVARYGYLAPEYTDRTEVDFPGMPFAIRVAHLFVRDWIVAGLLVSFVAGAVAAAALWRLAADELDPKHARFAAVSMIFFPYAVFLFAAYSEAIFLAFATTSWLAARRNRWWLAGLLGAGAASTRVTGIAFCFALVAAYVVVRRRTGQPLVAPAALALALPPLPVLGYVSYLRARTGHWDAYQMAMRAGWDRATAWPWKGWSNSWAAATDGARPAEWSLFYWGELAAVVVCVVLTVVLLRDRRWDEAAFLGAVTLLISSTNWYASGIRAVLVAFPLYLMLARAAARQARVVPVYLWLCAPVMFVFVAAFTQGRWVD